MADEVAQLKQTVAALTAKVTQLDGMLPGLFALPSPFIAAS